MEKCEKCGRKFRSRRALGGHMSTAHAGRDGGNAPRSVTPVEGEAEATSVPGEALNVEWDGEPGKMESIRNLLRQGYSPRQIKEAFGYAASTVDQVVAGFIEPEGRASREGRDDGLPVVLKKGQGTEVVTPEAVLRRYMDGDADERELRGMMKLRAAMLMVMDLINMRKADAEAFALEVKPILDLMKETRAEQDAAAERARASSVEAAREAAHEALGQAMPYIDQRLKAVEEAVRKPDIATTPHPMQGVMARVMETMFDRLLAGFGFGGQPAQPGQRQVPGFSYEKVRGADSD